MTLVDSSCWVHYFRRNGDASVRGRVSDLIRLGEAAWCPFIRLELWNGVGNDQDRTILRAHETWMPDLPITGSVWSEACALASRCRIAGKTAPATDVLIAACARYHRVEVEAADLHFGFLMTL